MDEASKLIKRAQRDYQAGDRRAARKKYEQLLRKVPRHLDAHYLLGTLLAEMKEWSGAESHLKTALTIKPDSGYILMNLGTLCRMTAREAEALAYYRRAALLLPDEPTLTLNLGSLEVKLGLCAEAEEHLSRYLAWHPDHTEARVQLGDALRGQGHLDAAASQYQAAIDLAGSTPSLEFLLSCCRGQAPDTAPQAYVRHLFDTYARTFDQQLMGELECRIPAVIQQTVLDFAGEARRFGQAVDLGCGTGLTGERLRSRIDWLAGVDLSPHMVDLARAKRIYDTLDIDDVCTWMTAQGKTFDLVLAGDLAIYLGALTPLFSAVAANLSPDGLFVLSAEETAADGFELRPSGRFAHGQAYVTRTAAERGMHVHQTIRTPLRKEAGQWIEGFVALIGRIG